MNLFEILFNALGVTKPPPPVLTPPAPSVPRIYEPPWLSVARKQVGFVEKPGNQGIEKYCGLAKCGHAGDPWCAIFVNAMLETVGLPGTMSAMARSFENSKYFKRLKAPAMGCIVTIWRGSKSSGSGHVFFYLGENDNGFVALGGNQKNQVCVQYEPKNRLTGYWWPTSLPDPALGAIYCPTLSGVTDGSEE